MSDTTTLTDKEEESPQTRWNQLRHAHARINLDDCTLQGLSFQER